MNRFNNLIITILSSCIFIIVMTLCLQMTTKLYIESIKRTETNCLNIVKEQIKGYETTMGHIVLKDETKFNNSEKNTTYYIYTTMFKYANYSTTNAWYFGFSRYLIAINTKDNLASYKKI